MKSIRISPEPSVFKSGAFTDYQALNKSHPFVMRRSHYLMERVASGWRLTIRTSEGQEVRFFSSDGAVNQARLALSDAGFIGLRSD